MKNSGRNVTILEEINVGERIKALRQKQKLTLQEVAQETGFSTALLSKIENNVVSPPIPTLWKIAAAMGVRIGYFFQEEGIERRDFVITRKDHRRVVFREGSKHGYSYESLSYGKKDARMEPFVVTLSPEERRGGQTFFHEGEELIFILEGRVEFLFSGQSHVLEPGDSVYFNSHIEHRLIAMDGKDAKTLQVVYYL